MNYGFNVDVIRKEYLKYIMIQYIYIIKATRNLILNIYDYKVIS